MRPPPLVAHVIRRLDYGGLENGLVNLINHMPAQCYRHAVICLAGFSEFRERIRRAGVEVVSIDKRPGKDPAAYLRLFRVLRRLRPDVVHTRNLGTIDAQWVALLACVGRRVHGEHGWEASDPQGRSARTLRIRRLCRPAIHRYVTMSMHLADWLERDVGVAQDRIQQIYSGVDTQRFCPDGPLPAGLPWPAQGPGKPLVVGTVARLDPVKNHRLLLDAFAGVLNAWTGGRDQLRLMIVGDGPLRDDLQSRASELGIAGSLWWPGARDDIPALMRAMDVFVLPSLNEGISNTILEAMASGRPVVASRVGGNSELVQDGVCGALHAGADREALCAALTGYLTDPALRAAHGAAARERAERQFSLQAMVEGYLRLYDGLMAGSA